MLYFSVRNTPYISSQKVSYLRGRWTEYLGSQLPNFIAVSIAITLSAKIISSMMIERYNPKKDNFLPIYWVLFLKVGL